MAIVSFQNLDQFFYIVNPSVLQAQTPTPISASNFEFSSLVDEVHFFGVGFAYASGSPAGGTVTSIEFDFGNDAPAGGGEIVISGLSIAAADLQFDVGSADERHNRIMSLILGGDDVFNLTLANYAISLILAGDGASITDGGVHAAGDDLFTNDGTALSGDVFLSGDYHEIAVGAATGGDDQFTVGAFVVVGDFGTVGAGASGVGGDDAITPTRLVDPNVFFPSFGAYGDAGHVFGSLTAGDDLIDLRATDLVGFKSDIYIFGDAGRVEVGGSLIGGDDTIHGSSRNDQIFGDHFYFGAGQAIGGNDQLLGYDGNDTIFGNEGRDFVSGGSGQDTLAGGPGGDTVDGGDDSDFIGGDQGDDWLSGGDGLDFLLGGNGADTILGGAGDDGADGGGGDDVIVGGTGRDGLHGGGGHDRMSGGSGNDGLGGGEGADTIRGEAGYDFLTGDGGDDILDGGDLNDRIFGGAGKDKIIFRLGGDVDTLGDFSAGIGRDDVIRLVGFGAAFDSFAEVMAAATDDGRHTTIDFGGGDILIIKNVVIADLAADDFLFG